jgi:hypothetical protein
VEDQVTELEEVYVDIQKRLEQMNKDQIDRYFNGKWHSVADFLNSEREEQFTNRMKALIEAQWAIEAILGR